MRLSGLFLWDLRSMLALWSCLLLLTGVLLISLWISSQRSVPLAVASGFLLWRGLTAAQCAACRCLGLSSDPWCIALGPDLPCGDVGGFD